MCEQSLFANNSRTSHQSDLSHIKKINVIFWEEETLSFPKNVRNLSESFVISEKIRKIPEYQLVHRVFRLLRKHLVLLLRNQDLFQKNFSNLTEQAAREEREARRKADIERKKQEAAERREREKRAIEAARQREHDMLMNIASAEERRKMVEEERRRKEEAEEEEERLREQVR